MVERCLAEAFARAAVNERVLRNIRSCFGRVAHAGTERSFFRRGAVRAVLSLVRLLRNGGLLPSLALAIDKVIALSSAAWERAQAQHWS